MTSGCGAGMGGSLRRYHRLVAPVEEVVGAIPAPRQFGVCACAAMHRRATRGSRASARSRRSAHRSRASKLDEESNRPVRFHPMPDLRNDDRARCRRDPERSMDGGIDMVSEPTLDYVNPSPHPTFVACSDRRPSGIDTSSSSGVRRYVASRSGTPSGRSARSRARCPALRRVRPRSRPTAAARRVAGDARADRDRSRGPRTQSSCASR